MIMSFVKQKTINSFFFEKKYLHLLYKYISIMKSIRRFIEAAMSRKQYVDVASGIHNTILEHALLVLMYPDAIYQEHWRKEIRAFARRLLIKLKTKSQNKYDILYRNLVEEPYDSFTDDRFMIRMIQSLSKDKSELTLQNKPSAIWSDNKSVLIKFYDDLINAIVSYDPTAVDDVVFGLKTK